ncbi:MAG: hypothetical protein H6713_20380 [Myxococcales bacterium]|nr:hypothetical protein [Myxococcales bacterium]MCB9752318.1 hypothetical protein [Myxococcales bacterium]
MGIERWRIWGLCCALLAVGCGDGQRGDVPADPATPVRETPRPAQASQGDAVAYVELVAGDVRVRDRNNETFPAQVGLPILEDDVFVTSDDAYLIAELRNGYLVRVDEDLEVAVRDFVLLSAPKAEQTFTAQLEGLLTPAESKRIGADAAMSERIAGWQSRLESGDSLPSESRAERAVSSAEAPEEADPGDDRRENMGVKPDETQGAEQEPPEDEEPAREEFDDKRDGPAGGSAGASKSKRDVKRDDRPERPAKSAKQSSALPTAGLMPEPDVASKTAETRPLEEPDGGGYGGGDGTPEQDGAAPASATMTWSIRQGGKDIKQSGALPGPFARELLERGARELRALHPTLGARVQLLYRVEDGAITRVVVRGGVAAPPALRELLGRTITLDVSPGDVWVVIDVELR